MLNTQRATIAVALVALTAFANPAMAEAPFTISADFSNRIVVAVTGQPPLVEISGAQLQRSATGTEKSQCRDYGRASSSVAGAEGKMLTKDANALSLRLSSSAVSQGGHYRTCVQCIAGNCMGLSGNDTGSTAEATAMARLAIRFNDKLLYNAYDLRIVSAGDKKPLTVAITSPAGLVTSLGESDAGVYRINAEPGDVYYVDFKLVTAAANNGGCCSDQSAGVIEASLRLDKAPILSGLNEPFIVGGEPTQEYKNVVALLVNGVLHCTGTIIGKKTILTAAHCIHGYERLIAEQKMTFVIASTITQPETSGQVTGYDYPRGPDIKFNPRFDSLDHDIGVVYVTDPFALELATLHLAEPKWTDIVRKKPVHFVGFGLTRAGGALVGSGAKREALWHLADADDWRFYYQVAEKNTCKGDSGGPSFLPMGANVPMLLVGVTSGGDKNCTRGMSTRLDAHRKWLDPRVK